MKLKIKQRNGEFFAQSEQGEVELKNGQIFKVVSRPTTLTIFQRQREDVPYLSLNTTVCYRIFDDVGGRQFSIESGRFSNQGWSMRMMEGFTLEKV